MAPHVLILSGTVAAAASAVYPKTILSSGQVDVTVYLPGKLGYYNSTRFDWGSMIGEITLGEAEFFSDLWRTATDPNWGKDHDPSNPEGVLGLASEFGCGSDGPDCPAGWGRRAEASNGVLGYHEAGMGDPFLKIGVGKLIKGSCDACKTDTNYHFNSRYDFAEPPVWTVSHPSSDTIDMIHEASLGVWGYRFQRHLQVHGDMLVMRSELTNTGSKAFKTVQYTHNFLAFNRQQIGPPLKLQFGQDLSSYSEPGNEQGWSVPIASRFVLTAPNVWTANSALPAGGQRQSILTQFEGPEFNLNASSSYIADSGLGPAVVSEMTAGGHERLHGYKFFAQATAVCPEPSQEIALAPQESASWEQRLVFSLHGPSSAISKFFTGVNSPSGEDSQCIMEPMSKHQRGVAKQAATSLHQCMAQCLLYLKCQGVQYHPNTQACDLMAPDVISSAKAKQGYYCLTLDIPDGQRMI